MNSEIDRLCSVVAESLGISRDHVTPTTMYSDLEAWNSIGHLQIMLGVETAYNVQFDTEEMPSLNSIPVLAKRLGLATAG
jgi:acyl carrier protein